MYDEKDEMITPMASDYVLYEDAERFAQEPTIRDSRPEGLQTPKSVYLVYLSFDAHCQFEVRQNAADFEDAGQLETAERNIFNDAANGVSTYENFEGMVWNKPTFITFVIDRRSNPGWDFYYKEEDGRHNPIRFFRRKDKIPTSYRIYQENYSFFEGELFDLDDGTGRTHKAFRCINFIRDEQGPLRRGQKLWYCFQIYLQVPFLLNGTENWITMLIDPDGQNQGPP